MHLTDTSIRALNIAAILHEIDAEIEKLKQAREIIAGLYRPVRRTEQKSKKAQTVTATIPRAEPALVVLPPRAKREYRTRAKPTPQTARALAAPVSLDPVFVPRATSLDLPAPDPRVNEFDPQAIEAAMKQNLLSGADHRF